MLVIIFSKNRAMQLDLLLRSLQLHCLVPHRVFVAWTNSPGIHRQAAAELAKAYPDVTFIDDAMYGGPGRTVDTLMDEQYGDKTMLLVDDAVLRAPIRPSDPPFQRLEADPTVEQISTRLYRNITTCYALGTRQSVPKDIDRGIFQWRHASVGDWNYPASIDGGIWLTSWLRRRLEEIDWNTPNELEAQLAVKSHHAKPLMALYPDFAPLLTIPANRVQHQFPNRHGGGSIDDLCSQYLEGKRIDLEPFKTLQNTAVHVEMPLPIK